MLLIMNLFNFLIDFIKERAVELQGGMFGDAANILLVFLAILLVIWYFQKWKRRIKKFEIIINQANRDLNDFFNGIKRRI
jgi:hypothetical protein